MNISASILLLLLPAIAAAQNYPGMNDADVQNMMKGMQKAETCMQNVDQAKLKVVEQRSRQMEAEVKSLCESGKRDKAQKKVISFGEEIAKDPTVREMRKCSEMMKGMMPEMPFMAKDRDKEKDRSSQHICD